MGMYLTIKRILNNVHIDISTYIIILLSFLAGYFEYVFLTILIIVVHELGHYISGYLLGLKVRDVRIFMFGGVTTLDESLNLSIKKEIIMILMGPFTQLLFFMLIYYLFTLGYVNPYTYEKIVYINTILFSFNLSPILPLDGGKILNNILDIFLPFDLSHVISIVISILFIPFMFLFDNKLFVIVMVLFLVLNILDEINLHKYRLKKLLLERKLNKISFKKCINIDNIKNVRRGYSFNINVDGHYVSEKTYYENFFLNFST